MRPKQYSKYKIRSLPETVNATQLSKILGTTFYAVYFWYKFSGLPVSQNQNDTELVICRDELYRWMESTKRLKP